MYVYTGVLISFPINKLCSSFEYQITWKNHVSVVLMLDAYSICIPSYLLHLWDWNLVNQSTTKCLKIELLLFRRAFSFTLLLETEFSLSFFVCFFVSVNRTSDSVAMDVLRGSVKHSKGSKVMLPPKRGQVKVRIASSFVRMVSKVISKAVALGRKTRKARKVIAKEVWMSSWEWKLSILYFWIHNKSCSWSLMLHFSGIAMKVENGISVCLRLVADYPTIHI